MTAPSEGSFKEVFGSGIVVAIIPADPINVPLRNPKDYIESRYGEQ